MLLNTSAAGSPGGFRVAGAGGNCTTADPTCTGGTIQTSTGHGVDLNTADNVALNSIHVTTSGDSGINGSAVNGFVLNNALVDSNGNDAVADDSGVEFTGLTGTGSGGSNPTSITNSTIRNNFEFQMLVTNTAGTLTSLDMSGNAISDDGTTGVTADLLSFIAPAGSTATMRLNVTSGSFTGAAPNTGAGLNCDHSGTAGTLTCNASGATFTNNNIALSASQANGGNLAFDISNNVATGTRSHALNLFLNGNSSGTSNGQFVNNTVGTVGVTNSGSALGIGIRIQNESGAAGAPPLNVLISGNTVQEIAASPAVNVIQGLTGQTASRSTQLTITNNILRRINGNRAIVIQQNNVSASPAGAAGTTCADISGNEMNNIFGSGGDGSKLRLVQRPTGTFNIRQTSLADLAAANSPPNGVATTTTTTAQINFVGTLTFNGGQCTQPSLPLVSMSDEGSSQQFLAAKETPSQWGTPEGFSAGGAVEDSLRKVRRGLANSERGQVLGAGSETSKTVRTAAPLAALAGETISIPIGTLKAGDSVTITFQVTVANPFPASVQPPQVSNQGMVTADGGVSVLTDDPSEAGASNPTVTPILTPPTININDATVAEPASGSTNMLFTVTLSNTYTQTVTVNYQTANGGANPATAGTDYTTSSGTVTFAAGETVKTVAVPVLADGTPAEGSETFLVNLSSPSNSIIGDGQATGTITDESAASPVIISELRENGPNGANDEFVELLNTTDTDITVTASDASGSGWALVKRGADCDATPVIVGVIPEGTVIPARGNYLFTGSAYSLGAYATGDAALSADIELNSNVGLFTVANLANISSVNRLDAVGFGANTGGNCDLLREGNNLPQLVGFSVDYSFVRKVTKGLTVDTNDNASDFIFVDTNGTSMGAGQRLGAPGPEGLNSPRGPVPCSAQTGAAKFARGLIDPTVSAAAAPNVVRDNTSNPAQNSTFGTLDFRRTWTNNTGAAVTRLRFRITNLSTFPEPSGTADLRARTSSAIVVTTAGGPQTVLGTTLEQPPFQPNGGGINASLSAGTITLATPLASGASVNLRFLFGIQQTGDYDIGVVLESAPTASGKDFWRLTGHTETGGHTDAGCNRPPVADAGQDQTVECSNGQASVTLDGSGSTDPDGDTPLTYEWKEGATLLGTGQTINVSLPTGSHTITLTVTDPSGDSSQDTVTINVVDTTAPQVTAPPDVTVYTGPGAGSCSATVSDAQLGTATASDSCQGDLTPQRTGVPAGNNFPVGTTQVTYTATDAAGNVGSDVQNVTVIDNTPPVVTPPANVVTSADAGSCSANVDPGQATATDNCSVQSVVGTRSDNQPLNAPYPVGTTTITWTATDASGNQATAQQTVTVQDNQPPTVSASVTVTTMGPPFNHALINVGLSATASDNCGPVGPLQVKVYSDEDDGSGPHSPDAADIGLGTLKLRRERDGGGNGRVYLIVVKATDASGNTAVSVVTVTVPSSNSAAAQASVNAQAAAAAAYASANGGAAPAGYFVVGP
ncbi:MAG: HYR domain-containing protein [Pyrinomonadaceae bacterium]